MHVDAMGSAAHCRCCETDDLAFIDQLRGAAILAVMLAHVSQRLPLNALRPYTDMGNAGVQLFFVVSAFTLTRSANRRGLRSTEQIVAFYARRLFRIAPLYWCGIALYAILAWVMDAAGMPQRWAGYSIENVAVNAMLLHGLSPSANISVVHGGWSIGTEVLFYAAFPALYAALAHRSWRFISITSATAMLAAACFQVVQLAAGWRDAAEDAFWYSSILNQLPVFLIGMAVYRAPRSGSVLLGVGMIIAAATLFLVSQSPAHLYITPAVTGAFCAFVISYVQENPRPIWWLARVGKWSFALYIVHFVFGTYALAALISIVPPMTADSQTAVLPIAYAGVLACSCAVAAAVHYFIEQPAIRFGAVFIDRLSESDHRVGDSVPVKRTEASPL